LKGRGILRARVGNSELKDKHNRRRINSLLLVGEILQLDMHEKVESLEDGGNRGEGGVVKEGKINKTIKRKTVKMKVTKKFGVDEWDHEGAIDERSDEDKPIMMCAKKKKEIIKKKKKRGRKKLRKIERETA
jgi:hypothetical protein